MPQEKIPEGQLFTHVYCDRGTPIEDNEIFRRRIGTFCNDLLIKYNSELGKWLTIETGLVVPYRMNFYSINKFILDIELKHMLNSITLDLAIYKN